MSRLERKTPSYSAQASPRPKTCRNPECRCSFVPARPLQVACSVSCALAVTKAKQARERLALEKLERREIRVRKQKLKSRSDHAREAQAVINRYVRLRDAHLGCGSCDRPASWDGQWHCSHFRSVGAAPHLRFNLWNMHKACSICNNHLSGNIAGYRPRLIEKIGQDKVDWLERNHSTARHDIPYLIRLKAVFTKKAKRIERRLEEGRSWIAV